MISTVLGNTNFEACFDRLHVLCIARHAQTVVFLHDASRLPGVPRDARHQAFDKTSQNFRIF
jgi:hypothetical protein